MVLSVTPAHAAIIQLTDNNYGDEFSQIDNGQVVWSGSDGNDTEIYFYNAITTVQLTNNDYVDDTPYISAGKVVWMGYDGNDGEIFLYDGTEVRQLTDNFHGDDSPRIDNGQVVWSGYDGTNNEIFLYDGSTVRVLTENDSYNNYQPKIDDGKVTWLGDDGNDTEIFYYDSTAVTQLTNNSYNDRDPQIDDGEVVWRGNDGSDDEIYYYNGTTIVQLTEGTYTGIEPQISDGQVVWRGSDGVNFSKIFLYDGTTIKQLTQNTHSDRIPQIDAGKVTWVSRFENDLNNFEIFFYDGNMTYQVTTNSYIDYYPQISDGKVVWRQSYADKAGEIFLWDGVLNNNQAPVLAPVGDKTVGEGSLLEFTLSASDPDGDNLTFSVANLPDGATFNPETATFSWTPTFSQEGNYPNIEFTVTDDGSPIELDTELISITVGDINRPPEFDPILPQEVQEEGQLSFTVNATDPDGNSFTYSVENLPAGASFDQQTGVFSWTPTLSQSGPYLVTFGATDDGDPVEVGSIDVPITVGDNPTPTEQAEEIVDTVIDTYDFPTNVENAYLSNLKKVELFIAEGKIQPAINQLNAFINKVESDYAQGTITQAIRDDLIGRAQALLADLQ